MKAAKVAFRIFKLVVVVLSIVYIAYKLYSEYINGAFFSSFQGLTYKNSMILALVCSLVFVNWAFEAVKFRILLNPIQKVAINTSLKAVLAGISVSIFTPKRVGDFGGRVFALEGKNRVKGIFATLLGSYAQLLVTLCFGLILLPAYLNANKDIVTQYPFVDHLFYSLTVVILLSLFVYFNIPVIGRYLAKIKYMVKYQKFIEFVNNYTKVELVQVLGMSTFRYAIFAFQMFALFVFFGVEIGFNDAIVGISQVYLFMTVIPTVALGELGIRGSLSVWVLGVFVHATSGILAASVLLWVLNLAIPAIIGNYFLLKFKY